MDIDKRLDDIIFRYNLDRHYPEYSKMIKAKTVIKEITKTWAGKKVLCVATLHKDIRHIKKLQQIDGDINYLLVEAGYKSGFQGKYDYCKLYEKLNTEKYDEIWLISHRGRAFVNSWFYSHKITYTSIYDEFARKGLMFSHEWDEFIVDCCEGLLGGATEVDPVVCEIIYLREKLLTAPKEMRDEVLLRLYFLLIHIRDFLALDDLVTSMPKNIKDEVEPSYSYIVSFIDEIRKILKERENKGIFVHWIDACAYERLDNMPYLSQLRDNNMSFENIYPSTPMTNPSLRAILCSKTTVDDKAYKIENIDEENSVVRKMLAQQGYHFRAIGERWDSLMRSGMTDKVFSGSGHVPCSMIFWQSLREYLKTDENVFILSHFMLESHYIVLLDIDMDSSFYDKTLSERYSHSLNYMDKQLKFYHNLMANKNNKAIYLSDHANGLVDSSWHTFLIVCEGTNRKVNELCSHLDFYKILSYVLDGGKKELIIGRDYAPIQDLPIYSRESIKFVLNRKTFIPELFFRFDYKGCLTSRRAYFHFNLTGNELFIPNDYRYFQSVNSILVMPSWYKGDNYIIQGEDIEIYREKANLDNVVAFTDEKLRYAKLVKRVYDTAYERNALKIKLINEMMQDYPDESIAIRMGGLHTIYLYKYLSEKNRKKIKFIIDGNKRCVCSFIGIPILDMQDVNWDNITAVVLSSKKHLSLLKKETEKIPANIEVLNIYETFIKNGLIFNYEFWNFEPNEDEWNYGCE